MRTFTPGRQWRPIIVIAVPFTLLDAFLLLTDDRWIGEFGWTVDWANGGLYLASSLLAGLSALVTVSYLGGARLLVSVSRVGVLRLVGSLWLWTTSIALTCHAAVVGVALIVSATARPSDAVLPAAFGYAILSSPLATAAGVAFAAMIRSVIAAPVALAVAYLGSYAAALGTLQLPVMVGGQFTTMAGLAYDSHALVQYWLRTVGFVVLLGVLATAWMAPRRTRLVSVIGAVAGAGIVASAALLPVAPDRITVGDTPRLICAQGTPTVCVAAGHTRRLAELQRHITTAVQPMIAAGIPVVGRLEERPPIEPVDADAGVLDLPSSDLNALHVAAEGYADAVTLPRDCADYRHASPATDDLLKVHAALAAWLLGRLDGGATSQAARLPDSWARGAYADLRECKVESATLDALPTWP